MGNTIKILARMRKTIALISIVASPAVSYLNLLPAEKLNIVVGQCTYGFSDPTLQPYTYILITMILLLV